MTIKIDHLRAATSYKKQKRKTHVRHKRYTKCCTNPDKMAIFQRFKPSKVYPYNIEPD